MPISKVLLLCFFGFLLIPLSAQEICDNGLDDDNDGLIDLNDTIDCSCAFVSEVESLFPNPSFDEFSNAPQCASSQSNGAPDGPGQANCIAGWQQASNATTDAWHLLTYNGNAPFWPGSIPQPIPSGLAVAGFFTAVNEVPGYREYFGACLPDGPTIPGVQYRLDFQLGFGADTGNGIDSLVSSPENVELAIYGIVDCDDIPFFSNQCPENAGASGWELITTFSASASQVPSWENVIVNFVPTQSYAALAVGGTCDPVFFPPNFNLLRHYYFVDDLLLNTVNTFNSTITVGGISIFGDDICDDDATMMVETFPEASYQWYRNGVAINGATDTEYYPPLDNEFASLYSCRIVTPEGCGVAGPVELIRPLVTNAFQDSVFFCDVGFNAITPVTSTTLIESFQWQDGSTDPFLVVDEPGNYSVTITSFCTQTIETIVVTDDAMPTYNWVVEPEVYCLGDTISTYIETDWQINASLFGNDFFSFVGLGDTATFIIDQPGFIEFRVDGTACLDNFNDQLIINVDGPPFSVSTNMLSCDQPVITAKLIAPTIDDGEFTFLWQDATGDVISIADSVDISLAGEYSLTLFATDSECSYTREFEVVLDPADILIADAMIPLLSCSQESGVLAVTPQSTDELVFDWFFEGVSLAADGPELIVTESGNYALYVSAVQGNDTICRQTYFYEVPFNPNSVDISLDVTLEGPCSGNSVADFEITPELAGWAIEWFAAGENVLIASSTNTVAGLPPGDYELRLTNPGGNCQEVILFTVITQPQLSVTGEPLFVDCPTPEQPVLSGGIQVAAGNGLPPYQYRITNGEFADTSASGTFLGLAEGEYELEVTDANGCNARSLNAVMVSFPEALFVEAGNDRVIRLGDSDRISAQTVGGIPGMISWSPETGLSCTDCLNPMVTPLESTLYTITVLTEEGSCPATDSLFVAVEGTGNLYVPNAFSPNQDGINDLFTFFPDLSFAELLEFRVYDRWGGEVFAENIDGGSLRTGWDGTGKNGQPLDPGVFVYLIRVRLINGEERRMSGAVSLLR
ncbi:hypothetical protein CEQ90_10050 [Lewinellaceae bacterium SD302]|nr:hypothetical protein CEQ90_10050 [Lewinellaceae bacterium SD302]